MNLGIVYNYMNFMEDLSDEYIQISKDGMIRKEKLNIEKDKIENIKELIDLIIKDGELRMSDFNGYFLLPRLERPWNKYMLVGIIRSYFKNEYDIENTTKYYDTTDFIIRRIN